MITEVLVGPYIQKMYIYTLYNNNRPAARSRSFRPIGPASVMKMVYEGPKVNNFLKFLFFSKKLIFVSRRHFVSDEAAHVEFRNLVQKLNVFRITIFFFFFFDICILVQSCLHLLSARFSKKFQFFFFCLDKLTEIKQNLIEYCDFENRSDVSRSRPAADPIDFRLILLRGKGETTVYLFIYLCFIYFEGTESTGKRPYARLPLSRKRGGGLECAEHYTG